MNGVAVYKLYSLVFRAYWINSNKLQLPVSLCVEQTKVMLYIH